jgi:four helix bundle protein
MSPPIQRFEDLVAWQKARALTSAIYALSRTAGLSRDAGLSSQMQRAAVSIMANIAEGFERKGQGEFYRYLVIAKSSCAEVGSHSYVALDAHYVSADEFSALKQHVDEVGRLIGGLAKAVAQRRASQ